MKTIILIPNNIYIIVSFFRQYQLNIILSKEIFKNKILLKKRKSSPTAYIFHMLFIF